MKLLMTTGVMTGSFHHRFSEEEELWGIFICNKNMQITTIVPTAQF